jgi:branched-chain amino acid transport system substrate-binding protein
VKLRMAAANAVGVRLVLSTAVSTSAADYTAVCQSAASSGAQSMFIAAGRLTQFRVAAACDTQGVHVKLVDAGGLNATVLGKPGSDGLAAASATAPWFDDSIPVTKDYHDAVAKYAPGLGDLNGPNTMWAWASGKLFEAAVKASKASDITPASVRAGLLKLRGGDPRRADPAVDVQRGQADAAQLLVRDSGGERQMDRAERTHPGLRTGVGHRRDRGKAGSRR